MNSSSLVTKMVVHGQARVEVEVFGSFLIIASIFYMKEKQGTQLFHKIYVRFWNRYTKRRKLKVDLF